MLEKDVSKKISKALVEACQKYFKENIPDTACPDGIDVSLKLTRDHKHGDLTSNIAMRLARAAKRSPQDIGAGVVELFKKTIKADGLDSYIGNVELKGGFINLWLSDGFFLNLIEGIQEQAGEFGKNSNGEGKKVNIEYVSANPTGPLTIAHGRQAAIGDALSRILRFNGYDVTDEYYLNDYGRQIRMLGVSVQIRYRNLFGNADPMPEDGYMGEYIVDIAKEIRDAEGDSFLEENDETDKFFIKYAVDHMMGLIREDLKDFGVEFDVWTSQAGIEDRNEVQRVLADLEKEGYIYDEEGAKWFSSTKLGDDKDRVVIKSDGSFTYLAPDIAYHRDKYKRGFDWLIDLLGPDHHGYIRRMKAAVQALGHDASSLDILIVQLVTLLRGEETVSMSTRRGEFVSLRELLDELGKDVTRFFFLSRRLDSHLDFDIDLAKKESSDNPVFYIQYAHARICSIKRFSVEKWGDLVLDTTNLKLMDAKGEKLLMRKLAEFPYAVAAAAESLEPNRIIVYLNELARMFHSFYTECRVISDDDEPRSKARLYLVESARRVLANGLGLLNIDFPEKM